MHIGNYLRVRGEYAILDIRVAYHSELPPRARRILTNTLPTAKKLGTTSACAENTNQGLGHGHRGWNYLRVRGEYPK